MLTYKLNGNLGKDPEIRTTNDGKEYALLYVASNQPGRDTTDWFNIAAFHPDTVDAARDLTKGDRIRVSGYVTTRTFEDRNGNTQRAESFIAQRVEPVDTTTTTADGRNLEHTMVAER